MSKSGLKLATGIALTAAMTTVDGSTDILADERLNATSVDSGEIMDGAVSGLPITPADIKPHYDKAVQNLAEAQQRVVISKQDVITANQAISVAEELKVSSTSDVSMRIRKEIDSLTNAALSLTFQKSKQEEGVKKVREHLVVASRIKLETEQQLLAANRSVVRAEEQYLQDVAELNQAQSDIMKAVEAAKTVDRIQKEVEVAQESLDIENRKLNDIRFLVTNKLIIEALVDVDTKQIENNQKEVIVREAQDSLEKLKAGLRTVAVSGVNSIVLPDGYKDQLIKLDRDRANIQIHANDLDSISAAAHSLSSNMFKSSERDQKILIRDLRNLSEKIRSELSIFVAEITNGIRKQMGTEPVVVIKSMVRAAEHVKQAMKAHNFNSLSHDIVALSEQAKPYGLNGFSEVKSFAVPEHGDIDYDRDKVIDLKTVKTLDDLKSNIYYGLKQMMFTDKHAQGGHALWIAGVETRPTYEPSKYIASYVYMQPDGKAVHYGSIGSSIATTQLNVMDVVQHPLHSQVNSEVIAKANLKVAQDQVISSRKALAIAQKKLIQVRSDACKKAQAYVDQESNVAVAIEKLNSVKIALAIAQNANEEAQAKKEEVKRIIPGLEAKIEENLELTTARNIQKEAQESYDEAVRRVVVYQEERRRFAEEIEQVAASLTEVYRKLEESKAKLASHQLVDNIILTSKIKLAAAHQGLVSSEGRLRLAQSAYNAVKVFYGEVIKIESEMVQRLNGLNIDEWMRYVDSKSEVVPLSNTKESPVLPAIETANSEEMNLSQTNSENTDCFKILSLWSLEF